MRCRIISVLFVVLASFTLSACGLGGGSGVGAVGIALQKKVEQLRRRAQTQAELSTEYDALVTLKPPYTKWAWGDDKNKISVGNAVWAVANQVGMRYEWKKSYNNTNLSCKRWANPDFENKPWGEAMEEILTPVNLTYVMENGEIVLIKKEDLPKRQEEIRLLETEIAALIESTKTTRRLPDPVIIFPLLDSQNATTEMGTLLSELAMFRCVYIPQKTSNLHLPALVDLYHSLGYDRPGQQVSDKQRNRIIRQFGATHTLEGRLKAGEKGNFLVELNISGPKGKKGISRSVDEAQLSFVPQWMALCVQEYLGTPLSSSQQRYLASPEIRSAPSMYELVELERDYWNGRRKEERWRRFLEDNPDCAFAFYRLFSIARNDESDEDSLTLPQSPISANPDNPFLKFMEADWYLRNKQYQDASRLYLELLKQDFGNEVLFGKLDESLLALNLGASAEALHTLWIQREPDSYIPLMAMGEFHVDYAWNARGIGWGNTVTKEMREKFEKRLLLSEQYLTKAHESNPTDPRMAARLITVAMGLGHEREQMEKWFQAAVQIDPRFYVAYRGKLTYLMPKWHGDYEGKEMFAFVRKSIADAPEDPEIGSMIFQAYDEMSGRWSHRHNTIWTDYYAQPEIWKEVKASYEQYLARHPDRVSIRNSFAERAIHAQDYAEAVRQFEIIGTDIDKERWSEKTFYERRAQAYKEAGRL
jgi:tetratricopeptide (TPR) repeat protein